MIDLESKKYWIWLSLIKNLGSVKIKKMLNKYNTPKAIWNLSKKELLKIEGIGEKTVNEILNKSYKNNIYLYMSQMIKENIGIITIEDKEYPQLLKNIYDPPIVLYYKGNKDILNNIGVSIIGCRECSEYGKKVAQNFSYNISKENINIISGLAKGIDTYSHVGAILSKGKTIAVVGN